LTALADGLDMDRLLGVASDRLWLAPLSAAGDAGSAQAPWASSAEPNPAAVIDFSQPADPAAGQQKMRHFISHIDAECFISLLQTMDPLPDDPRARTQYRRFYRQLREVLELPMLPIDPPPVGAASDPVK
jgi:hypothetical protein